MTSPSKYTAPDLPFPLFRLSSQVERYLLYDIDVIAWLRKTHHILGVLIGTLPQVPQQNVFLGLPLELMPEEAKLLSEKGLAYIVNDLDRHEQGLRSATPEQKDAFRRMLARQGMEAAKAAEKKKMHSTEKAMKKLHLVDDSNKNSMVDRQADEKETLDAEDSESFFVSPQRTPSMSGLENQSSYHSLEPWTVTPTTSFLPLPAPANIPEELSPAVKKSSYALFKHLHSLDYFLSPGLRFGCQFLVYPGDPLRFHSHFLAVGADWDEEISLLDVIGGGRLGTGVKKGWLIGGLEEQAKLGDSQTNVSSQNTKSELVKTINYDEKTLQTQSIETPEAKSRIRTFCIEWGGM